MGRSATMTSVIEPAAAAQPEIARESEIGRRRQAGFMSHMPRPDLDLLKGAIVIWMPSNHSKWHADYFKISDYPQLGRPQKQLPGPGVTILDENEQITPETLTILDLIADADVCLATGHLSLPEIRILQDEA